jgi:hypothetical protein
MDTLVKKYLLAIHPIKYTNVLLDSFMKQDSIRQYCSYKFSKEPNTRLYGITLSYKNFIHLKIYIKDSKLINRLDRKTWTFENILKCRISKIIIQDWSDIN